MTIFLPDPDIGRCKNVRHSNCSCGYSEALRCLDYEGICEFPAAMHTCSFKRPENNVYVYKPPTPKPWVKPGRVTDA